MYQSPFTRISMRNIARTSLVSLMLLVGLVASGASFKIAALRCEYRVNPLGIDETQPRLTWEMRSSSLGQKQTAYQVLVASSQELLDRNKADLWDSGKVESNQTANIVYIGKPLLSRQQCFWKVRVWDKDGTANWSEPALWTMGLLTTDDWKADYISAADNSPIHKDPAKLFLPPARQYRKEFTAAKRLKRATVYTTALGIYEIYFNGKRAGDAHFAPGWTDYHKRAYYWTYDVTPLIKRGQNGMGIWLADGWYSGYLGFGLLTGLGTERIGRYTYGKTPAVMAQLEIEYTDGSREVIPTDGSWKVTDDGPIREGDFLMGEFYDARKEIRGWTKPNFDDSKWQPAILAKNSGSVPANFYEFQNAEKPDGAVNVVGHPVDLGFQRPQKLEAFPGMPVRATEEIHPIAITSPATNVYIFNLGQNFAGVIRLKVKGKAGTVIKLRYGEMLYPDGRLMTENLRKARAIDHYVLKGEWGGEEFMPRFTFHGFQYVEVTGFPGKPDKDAITGIVLHSDTPLTSDFQCSDPVINRLFKNVVWTQRANFLDLPTDCPQRDERFGWTGDAQVYVRTATYNADVAAFYTKWIRELMESQRPSGTFPGYAPYPFQHGWDFGTAWCDAGVICPWTMWKAYGDTRIIERCWPEMVRFLEWRKSTSKDSLGINHGNAWGDWLSVGASTPIELIDTAYFALSTKSMADMAQAIGKDSEAANYRELFNNIKTAFNKKYVHEDGSLAVDTQTAYALALYMDLLPDDLRAKSGKILADKIRHGETEDNSGMTTGFIGTRPLLPVLSSVGEHDLAVKHFQSRKFPSWGYEVEQGATTIWERWNSYTKDKGFGGEQNAAMNSFAHYSFGAVCEWMFTTLAGIDTDGVGYKRIIIRPSPPSHKSNSTCEPINWVRSHYDSIHGRIVSNWRNFHGRFQLETLIPPNTTATVFLPTSNAEGITVNNTPLARARGAKLLRTDGDRAVISLQSGSYAFVSQFEDRPLSGISPVSK